MQHIIVLIAIMLAGGTIGGVASFLATEIPEKEQWPLLRRILLGVAAAFVVPLFLNMISSSILTDSTAGLTNYLVFGGFCVVAGFSSKAFLTSLSKKVLERVESVETRQEELEKEVDPILEKETEPRPETSKPKGIVAAVSADEQKVLLALANPKYTRRYLAGVASETGFEDVKAAYHLIALRDRKLVNKKTAKNLDLFWLSAEGWELVRALGGDKGT